MPRTLGEGRRGSGEWKGAQNKMYIMNQKRDIIVNFFQCAEVFISSDLCIKARPSGIDSVYYLGNYPTRTVAQAVLNDLFTHAQANKTYYMPDDDRALIIARSAIDDSPNKFSSNGKKTVRRGGS